MMIRSVETVTPLMPWYQLDGVALRNRVSVLGNSAASSVTFDSRRLVKFCDELNTREVWQKLAPTWDEFCRTMFGHPAWYIELVRSGVRLLDQGDDAPIPADAAMRAAKKMAEADPDRDLPGQGARTDLKPRDNITKSKRGTDPTYLAAVLKRDHPDIAAAVARGEYKSIREAALEAGIVKKPDPVQATLRAWNGMTEEQRQAFRQQIQEPQEQAPSPVSKVTETAGPVQGQVDGQLLKMDRSKSDERALALSGPLTSKIPGAAEWTYQMLYLLSMDERRLDFRRGEFASTLKDLVDHEAWNSVPSDKPYGNIDEMLMEEIGLTHAEAMNKAGEPTPEGLALMAGKMDAAQVDELIIRLQAMQEGRA
jgi:hypothetical protein